MGGVGSSCWWDVGSAYLVPTYDGVAGQQLPQLVTSRDLSVERGAGRGGGYGKGHAVAVQVAQQPQCARQQRRLVPPGRWDGDQGAGWDRGGGVGWGRGGGDLWVVPGLGRGA